MGPLGIEGDRKDSFNLRLRVTPVVAIARFSGCKDKAAAKLSDVSSQGCHLLFTEAGSCDVTQNHRIVGIQ